MFHAKCLLSVIAIYVLKRDVKLQLTMPNVGVIGSSSGEQWQIWQYIHIQHSVVAPPSGKETKVEHDCTTTNLSHPTVSQTFLVQTD